MRRRQFVTTASTTIAIATVAGCSGILDGGGGDGDTDSDGGDSGTDSNSGDSGTDSDGSGGGGSGPRTAVEAYLDASQDANSEAMSEAVHPNGTVPTSPSGGSMGEVTVQSIEVTEENDSQASVVVTFEITEQGETATGESTFEVRTHEGEWKVYAVQGGL